MTKLQPVGQVQLLLIFINKAFWNTAIPVSLLTVCGSFHIDLNSCNRDCSLQSLKCLLSVSLLKKFASLCFSDRQLKGYGCRWYLQMGGYGDRRNDKWNGENTYILGLEELMRERVLHIGGTGGAEAAVSAHSSAIFVGAVLRCRFRCCSWLWSFSAS